MKLYTKPDRNDWPAILKRPEMDAAALEPVVTNILHEVKANGDEAVKKFSLMFDKTVLTKLEVEHEEIDAAASVLSEDLKRAIHLAALNIGVFHKKQMEKEEFVETMPGIMCWRKSVPIEKVGLYIPGGTAPLFSTLLMLGIPATWRGAGKSCFAHATNQGHCASCDFICSQGRGRDSDFQGRRSSGDRCDGFWDCQHSPGI